MMKQDPIVFLFNSPLASGCDYVLQTMRIVQNKHPVYGIGLGDIISLPRLLLNTDKWITRNMHGAIIIRPISIIPGVHFRLVRMIAYIIAALLLRIYIDMKYLSGKKYLWFFEPFHIPPLLYLFPGYQKIYDCVDYYPGFHAGAKYEHDVLMQKSTYVFANSDGLAKQLRRTRKEVVQVPLGFADTLFTRMRIEPIPPRKKPFVAGYIGSISDRIDFPLLEEMIKELPSIQFLFVGPIELDVFGKRDSVKIQFEKLLPYKNVRWIHGVPKKEIPSVLATLDVGLIPYRTDNAFNRFSFPMKTMEYFAMGRPVISTNILTLWQYKRSKLLTIVNDAEDAILEIRFTQKFGWTQEKQIEQARVANVNSWEKKIRAITLYVNSNEH